MVRALFPRRPPRPVGRGRWVGSLLSAALLAAAGAAIPGTAPLPAQERSVTVPLTLRPTTSSLSVVERADSLFYTDPASALALLEGTLARNPDDYESQWRAARSALVLGVLEEDPDRELAWFIRADHYSDEALARDSLGLDGLYWSAASKGRLALQYGPRTTARLAQEVWDLTHLILEMDPRHPGAHNILGKLNQEVMSLSAWQRILGRWVLGTDPLREATWEKALSHHRAAVEADPETVLFRLDLGRTLQLSGSPEEALRVYDQGLNLPTRYPVDEKFKELMREYRTEIGPGT